MQIPPAVQAHTTPPAVLVIEDEPGTALLIRHQLLERSTHAFRVYLADSLAAARTTLAQGVQPDLVLLDLDLPDSPPHRTVERCRAMTDAPIVVLSGMDDIELIRAAIGNGAEDYLTKGGDAAAVRRAVRYALLRHQRDAVSRLAASVFANAGEGIVIADRNGLIVDVNAAFCDMTGFARDDVIGGDPTLLKCSCHPGAFYAGMWRALSRKGYWRGEVCNRRRNGEATVRMLTINAVPNRAGRTQHYVALLSDISAQKEHQRRLEHIAHHDALTGLPNRVLLADRMRQAMAHARRRGCQLVLAFIDLDGFKAINDEHGHGAGDRLLATIARRMKDALREEDTVARLGGDEFVAILGDVADTRACVPLILRLLAATSRPVTVGGTGLKVSSSIGVTFYPQRDDIDADELLRQADQAMYQAKLAGKNRYHLFDPEYADRLRDHHEQLERIRQGLERQEFVLHYQPKVNMRTGSVIGVEALIRWQHPEHGLLPPSHFLPQVKGHELEIALGEWVLDTALGQMERWQAQGLDLTVSVNVTARHLGQPNFVTRLRACIAANPLFGSGRLELEVRESCALDQIDRLSGIMEACRQIGLGFALDDFGTGHASLAYLKRLPADVVKVDRSFISDMLDDPDDLAVLGGVLGLAAAFRRQVVAEGVETIAHGELLVQLGCEVAQGFGIAHPMPADALPAWIAGWRPAPVWSTAKALSQERLPIIYAQVEQRAAVKAVEAHLRGIYDGARSPGEHQAWFAHWRDGAKASGRWTELCGIEAIDSLKRQIHQLARELVELHAMGRGAEALARLPELHALRENLLGKLNALATD